VVPIAKPTAKKDEVIEFVESLYRPVVQGENQTRRWGPAED
jgi:hypothetical protein